MSRKVVFGILALAVFGSAGGALAGIPCAAYSSSELVISRVTGTGRPCGTCDLLCCPAGDYDRMLIRVTVRDCLATPVPDCDVRLDLSGTYDPNNDVSNQSIILGRICGTPSRTQTTDASGAVEFPFWGGGAARFAIHWVVSALCADPEIELAARDDTLCIKSFAIRHGVAINFSDLFQFAPKLNAGFGYSADFSFCSEENIVNFRDTIEFARHYYGGHCCPGGSGESFALTRVIDGLLPDCDDIF
ncbi:MAG: hypothetical protein ABIH26_10765 [Candidatus Eisenbacteria bacterium]